MSLLLGALLGLFVPMAYHHFFPTGEQIAIGEINAQVSKTAAFTFYLNDLQLFDDAVVVIPTTNETQRLQLVVRNTGDLAAARLLVRAVFPERVSDITGTGNWKVVPGGSFATDRLERARTTHFQIGARNIIPPNDAFGCADLVLRKRIDEPFSFRVALRATADSSLRNETQPLVLFIPGTGESFVTSVNELNRPKERQQRPTSPSTRTQ